MKDHISIEIFSHYIDGRLADDRSEAVRRHAQSCPDCRDALAALGRCKFLLSGLSPIVEGDHFDLDFRRRLNAAIAAKAREGRFESVARSAMESLREILTPPLPALARVAAVVILIFSLGATAFYYNIVDEPLIVAMQGAVGVIDSKGVAAKYVKLGSEIGADTVISTSSQAGSFVDIEVSNKFAFRLKENSRLKVARIAPKHRRGDVELELASGRALVRIDKGFRGSVFHIKTTSVDVKALGTKFAVDTFEDNRTTWVGVLEGSVEVKQRAARPIYIASREKVVVASGQKTKIYEKEPLSKPVRLAQNEWLELEELYQIGRKPQVLLLVKNRPDRVIEVLRPAPLYISDEEPREMPELLERAIYKINDALKTKDPTKHLEAASMLEEMVAEKPEPKYAPQLLLFTGSYYNYIGYPERAVGVFEKVVTRYPETTFASIAQCAIGIIYEEKLNDPTRAKEAYENLLRSYPDSLEAIWLESRQDRAVRY